MAPERLQRVAERVYRLEHRYVNLYVLDLGKVVLVDTGTKSAGPDIRTGLKELGKEPEDVAVVLLTHHHVDHIGTAAAWKRDGPAHVSLHRADAPVAAGGRSPRSRGRTAQAKVFAALMGAFVPLMRTPPVQANRILDGGETLDVVGQPVEVLHVPGHTLGSCAFFLRQAGVLFAGDAVNGRAGNPELPIVAEDPKAAVDSYQRLTALQAPLLLPGHGSPVRTDGPSATRKAP